MAAAEGLGLTETHQKTPIVAKRHERRAQSELEVDGLLNRRTTFGEVRQGNQCLLEARYRLLVGRPPEGALARPLPEDEGLLIEARFRVMARQDLRLILGLWINASTTAQQKLVNVLEDKTGFGITTGNGVVTLDLGELVRSLGAELGISSATLDRIPPDAGELEIMRSDQLDAAQAGVQVGPGAEHLAAGARARPLRAGDLPRPRRAAGDAPQRRLRARPGRACGARRAAPGRRLRGGRPDRAELRRTAAGASGSSARRSSRRSAGPP